MGMTDPSGYSPSCDSAADLNDDCGASFAVVFADPIPIGDSENELRMEDFYKPFHNPNDEVVPEATPIDEPTSWTSSLWSSVKKVASVAKDFVPFGDAAAKAIDGDT